MQTIQLDIADENVDTFNYREPHDRVVFCEVLGTR